MKKMLLLFIFICLDISTVFGMDIFAFKRDKIIVQGRTMVVLVADTAKKREQGLSYTEVAALKRHGIDGMLFVFDNDEEKIFQAWYMKFDLVLLGLGKRHAKTFDIIDRKILNIGTTTNIKGKYVLEIPLINNSILGK